MSGVRIAFAAAVFALAAASGFTHAPSARADTSSALTSCDIAGAAVMPSGLEIYDKSSGGDAIAKFSGGSSPLRATDFFADGGQRVRVRTATGKGGFRIDGWIEASKLPLFTSQDVPVIAGHLSIAAQRQVKLVSAGSGQLRVKRDVGSPFSQTFTAWAPCGSLALSGGVPSGWTPDGHAQGYVAKKDVELYDSPDADRSLVTILTPDPSSNGILLWRKEKRNGLVRLEHHSDVVIDAWAKPRDLHVLKRGETMDQIAPPSTSHGTPTLKLAGTPQVVTATSDLPIRLEGSEKSKVVGEIESGTETYVLDIVAGWANVLPKSLHVMPAGKKQFWVKARDLGVKPKPP